MIRPIILAYHSINPDPNKELKAYAVHPDNLYKQVLTLLKRGYTSCTCTEYYQYLTGKSELQHKCFILTFDDGYQDFYTYAYPILKELGVKATVFLIEKYVDRPGWFKAYPNDEQVGLTKEQIQELHNYGIEFGSHTATHTSLNDLKGDALEYEIATTQELLRERLQIPIDFFCAPFGHYPDKAKPLIRKHFKACLRTAEPHPNKFCWKRIGIYNNTYYLKYLLKLFKDRV